MSDLCADEFENGNIVDSQMMLFQAKITCLEPFDQRSADVKTSSAKEQINVRNKVNKQILFMFFSAFS